MFINLSLPSCRSFFWLSCLLLGAGTNLLAQSDSIWQPPFQLPGVVPFSVDPLFRYHSTTLGEDFTIDATDPFNILLFYEDQQTIILLDRTLSVRASLDLRDTEILYATAVARSHDNNLWVYDELAGRLYRLNARGQLLFTSNDFRLSENLILGPTQMVRWGDRIVLNFPDRGLALFSVLGQLQQWWPITEVEDLFFNQNALYYQQGEQYYRYLTKQDLTELISWPDDQQPASYLLQFNRRYVLDHKGMLHIATAQTAGGK